MKINKRFLKIAILVFLAYLEFWAFVNFIFIPRFVIPKANLFISEFSKGAIKLSVDKISFHPLKGFILRDVLAGTEFPLEHNYVLRAKLVDIDLNLASLFLRNIEIKNFAMYGVELNISRGRQGQWNFTPLLDSDILKEKKIGGMFKLAIDRFSVKSGCLNYADQIKPGDPFERKFDDISIELLKIRTGDYRLNASSEKENSKGNMIQAKMHYRNSSKSLEGTVDFNTGHLEEYWGYYLKDTLNSLDLQAKRAKSSMQFSYSNNTLVLGGCHELEKAELSYGDWDIKGDSVITHNITFDGQKLSRDNLRIEVNLNNFSSFSGKYAISKNGSARFIATGDKISIADFKAMFKNIPVSFSGVYNYREQRYLQLEGKLSGFNSELSMRIMPDNSTSMDLKLDSAVSHMSAHLAIIDFKNHNFNLCLDGDIEISDLAQNPDSPQAKTGGNIVLSGTINGEGDEPSSWQGGLSAKITGLTLAGINFGAFNVNMIAKEGILAGNIPEMPFYKGNLRGRLQFGASKCGLELDIGNADLKTFTRDIFNTEETEGQFNLKGAFVSRWDNFENARAQGIFSLANCRINGLKFFSETEAGIASVLKGFILPDFKNIEGNFSLKKGILSFEAICSSITATLGINGKISYSGAMEATIATKIIGGSFLKTMRQIIIPISIPFDVIGNSVQVELKGKYPDLKHKARINTMGWLHDFTSALSKSFGRPYTMKDIWKENQE